MSDPREIECPDCDGEGYPTASGPRCPACKGTGWRDETDDEANDRAADAYSDMCESEPPLTMRERQMMDWQQKQELNR